MGKPARLSGKIVIIMNGIILIDKPAGMSSFGVVARVRRQLSEIAGKKVKVGHTGTLDPFATGLMLIVVGAACKRAGEFSKKDKVYEAKVYLGASSTTGDPEGEITQGSDHVPEKAEIEKVLNTFIGEVEQTPPIYSAIKVNGQRAYKLARRGEAVEIPKRIVTIYSLELLEYSYPEIKIRVHVSSGTYIRTLAEDIGKALGTGAYCSSLRRTKVAQYDVANAHDPEEGISGAVIVSLE